MKVYLIGSLRNPDVRLVARELRAAGFDVFDQWHAAGERADDEWQRYFQEDGATMEEAIYSPFVTHVFEFDKQWLDWADAAVLMLPAGRSGHLELGYMIGKGKFGIIYMGAEDERWDAMYRFAHAIVRTPEALERVLRS